MKKNIFTQKISFLQRCRKHTKLGTVLLLLFPLFIVLLAEYNQMQSLNEFIEFLLDKPSIIVFNTIYYGCIFAFCVFLFRRPYLAVIFNGICLYIFSCVEFFKASTSGSHFVITDLLMASTPGDIARFAYIKLTPVIVISFILLITYITLMILFNPPIKLKYNKSLLLAALFACLPITMTISPTVSKKVFSFFSINNMKSVNAFTTNEKFDSNSMLAFLAETTTATVENIVLEPEDYTSDLIKELINKELSSNSTNPSSGEFIKPNVVVIMSESFADFRCFPDLEIDSSIYSNFDKISKEGFAGNSIVPAFGGYTVRTEFELLFGLPVKSLNDPAIPHKLLEDRPQLTMPDYFKGLGYNTSYVHPFSKSFYSRDSIYSNYNFDNMYFDDNLTIDNKLYRKYTDDSVVFNEILNLIQNNTSPAYIHSTTMQNHQPYTDENRSISELDYYLEGIKHTDKELGLFVDKLKTIKEPTIVLFVGDHFPFFSEADNLYNKLGINSSNSYEVHTQKYFIWSNYDANLDFLPKSEVSSFYLPYMILDAINAPLDDFKQAMVNRLYTDPVYSSNYKNAIDIDKFLDVLTYDITKGEQYVINTKP